MYVTNSNSKNPIFQINQHIGLDRDIIDENGVVVQEGDGQGIDGIEFSNEVLSFNDSDVDELLFYINSQGGDVQKSLDIFNAISMSKQKTHSIITGFAFSCAGWIPLAADKVDMVQETGRWMCHMPYDPQNPEEHSEFMDEVVDIISRTIASKSGRNGKPKKTQEQVRDLMKKKTYFDAETMLEEGLIDRIVNTSGKLVRLEKDPITLNKESLNFEDKISVNLFYKEYQVAQNKLILEEQEKPKENPNTNSITTFTTNNLKINNMPFPKLVNRLNSMDSKSLGFKINLSEDSTEDVILDTIVRLENRLRAMNDDMMDKDDAMCKNKEAMDAAKKLADDKAKEAADSLSLYNSIKEKFDNMEMENKAMKEEKETASNKAKEADLKFRKERATNLVAKLIDQKKVIATEDKTIDEVKEYLVNKATENFEDVSIQFSITPVKISGPKAKTGKNSESVNLSIIDKMFAQNMERVKKNQFVTENGVKRNLYPELHEA